MTHKYGIEIPRDVEHAHEIDSRNGNTMWRDALKKEMYYVGVALRYWMRDHMRHMDGNK